jgi:hypothetical protein
MLSSPAGDNRNGSSSPGALQEALRHLPVRRSPVLANFSSHPSVQADILKS